MQARKNPSAYGMPTHRLSAAAFDKALEEKLILKNAQQLQKHGLVQYVQHYIFCEYRTSVRWLQGEHASIWSNLMVSSMLGVGGTNMVDIVNLKSLQVSTDEDGFLLQPTVPGTLMAQHYISFRTFVTMLKA